MLSISKTIKSIVKKYIYKKTKKSLKKCGDNVKFDRSCILGDPDQIEIGNDVYIGGGAYFWAKGGLKIGNNISFGPRVNIHTVNHRWEKATSIPYDGCSIKRPVVIEDNVWVGGHVTIIPGVTIGEGAIVAMGSVVVKNVEPCTIVGGNPAKVIKRRDINHYNKLKDTGMLWHKLVNEKRIRYKVICEGESINKEEILK